MIVLRIQPAHNAVCLLHCHRKQAEVNKMNEANEFYEDMHSRKQAATNAPADPADEVLSVSESESGNGHARNESGAATTKDGTPSPVETSVSQTPNG